MSSERCYKAVQRFAVRRATNMTSDFDVVVLQMNNAFTDPMTNLG